LQRTVHDPHRISASVTTRAFRALNTVLVPALDRGIGNPLPVGIGPVVVETTGRMSGEPRRVPLMSMRCGDRLVVSTVRSSSHWFANLEADQAGRVPLQGRFRPFRAAPRRGPLNVAVLDAA
jgi:deazaflavin-dependent oxidoreductase (nitroreductase family)